MIKINNTSFTARLTRDPEVKYLPSGQALMAIGCCINNSFKDKNGDWKDSPVFLDVEAWGKTAEALAETGKLAKGVSVYVEGSLKQDSWEKDGQKHTKIKVTANKVQVADGKNNSRSATPEEAAFDSKATAKRASDSLDFDDDDAATTPAAKDEIPW